MSWFYCQEVAVALGVLLSLVIGVSSADNELRVPLFAILRVSGPRLLAHWLAFTVLASAFLFVAGGIQVGALTLLGLQSHQMPVDVRSVIALAVGLVMPWSPPAGAWVARVPFLRLLSGAAGGFRDNLKREVTRATEYEETREVTRLLASDRHSLAVDKLFELHLFGVLARLPRSSTSSLSALDAVCRTRDRGAKISMLVRYLGVAILKSDLSDIAANPDKVIPSWRGPGDRRSHSDNRTAHRRRKTDNLPAYLRLTTSLDGHRPAA
jgi:hypothetical protein